MHLFPGRIVFGLLLIAGCAAANAAPSRPAAPAPDCMDARALEQARRAGPDMLLAIAAEARYRIDLAPACAIEETQSDLVVMAPHGWVCNDGRAQVRHGDERCAIERVERIDARTYADLARSADHRRYATSKGEQVLSPVQVFGRASLRGFAGSTDYCVAPRHVRGWTADASSVVVTTAPSRSGGNSHYRIDFARSCPELTWGSHLRLRSGVGNGMVCGNPGDVAIMQDDPNDPLINSVRARRAGQFGMDESLLDTDLQSQPGNGANSMLALLQPSTPMPSGGCPIAAVYPIDG